jgi:lysyl-tRNA synthetase class 1
MSISPDDLRALAEQSNAWPFEQAKQIVARCKKKPKDEVLFETGYGPSGLPHIGTFGEVARTTMVRHAFRVLTEDKIKTRLLAFSDDMDGLRKVPDNVPNKEMLSEHLGKPLTRIPDPFGTASSFGAHNGLFWIRSASTTSSPVRPTITRRGNSMRRCCLCWSGSTR